MMNPRSINIWRDKSSLEPFTMPDWIVEFLAVRQREVCSLRIDFESVMRMPIEALGNSPQSFDPHPAFSRLGPCPRRSDRRYEVVPNEGNSAAVQPQMQDCRTEALKQPPRSSIPRSQLFTSGQHLPLVLRKIASVCAQDQWPTGQHLQIENEVR